MAGAAEGDQPNGWVYDILIWSFSAVLDLFFREIHPRSSWKIPRKGPVIFVAAPHANQFVDGIVLMRTLRNEANRRVSILTAESSMRRKFVGMWSRAFGCVPVGRAMDSKHSVPGRICLPDPERDPCLIHGIDTDFTTSQFQVGGLLVLPSVDNKAASSEIAEIIGPKELRIKKPLKGAVAMQQLLGKKDTSEGAANADGHLDDEINKSRDDQGTKFLVAPKVDQSKVYSAVFEKLGKGGCVAIFPEGGSHDRTELLPLKAGVALMALGALAENPDCGLQIVPCGMNYFHAHKFRSRAVIEFGTPLEVPPEFVKEYKEGSRRDAIGKLLEMIYNSLVAVTVQTPDYDTLMLIQAVRRLYNPQGKRLPLPMIVELNRRLVKGYQRYKDEPRIIKLRKGVIKYNKDLFALNVRDHQLGYARLSIIQVVATLLYRLTKLLLLSIAVLPGLILFSPIFILGKVISIRRSKEALAASTVKVEARDVVATWKLLVALALAPTFNTMYTISLSAWCYYNNVQGYVPQWVPWWTMLIIGFFLFPTLCFAALRFGEIGMDIVKSLRPLVLSLNPSSGNTLVKLRQRREQLAHDVASLINDLGPQMFPDFEHQRIVNADMTPASPDGRAAFFNGTAESGNQQSASEQHADGSSAGTFGNWARWPSIGSPVGISIPRNESFSNLGNFGIFSSRPATPTTAHSRSSSQGRPSSSRSGTATGPDGLGSLSMTSPIKPMSQLSPSGVNGGGIEEISKGIRDGLRERRARASLAAATGSVKHESDEDADNDENDEEGMMMNGLREKKL